MVGWCAHNALQSVDSLMSFEYVGSGMEMMCLLAGAGSCCTTSMSTVKNLKSHEACCLYPHPRASNNIMLCGLRLFQGGPDLLHTALLQNNSV